MKQSRKPKTNKVLVTYAEQKSWYVAEVKSLLSVQFTAQFIDEDGHLRTSFYHYANRGYDWKDYEKQD
jgi:hypothetical protein|tara:strand:+ start:243 stop:446 length:204 start_codon:yes stop_codon:yes gene_type:complete